MSIHNMPKLARLHLQQLVSLVHVFIFLSSNLGIFLMMGKEERGKRNREEEERKRGGRVKREIRGEELSTLSRLYSRSLM